MDDIKKMHKLHLIACATGLAGADVHSGEGPLVIQQSPHLIELSKQGIPYQWDNIIVSDGKENKKRLDEQVRMVCLELAQHVAEQVRNNHFFTVIGGDHSCAIGTWSGVQHALKDKGDIGLIWIDAHMDAHTPETSESGNIHGMPVAALLGFGYSTLTSILNFEQKIKPENICLIGVRSFEHGEAELLKRLNVRVYFMDEVKQRGFATVLHEALAIIKKNTIGFGISLDMDGVDPLEAPGVDVPERDGIHVQELADALQVVACDPKLIGAEIVEFDPTRDNNKVTEKLLISFLAIIAKGKLITHDYAKS